MPIATDLLEVVCGQSDPGFTVDIRRALFRSLDNRAPCAVATLVAAAGSAPRPVGSQMLVFGDGSWVGSLSGGCIEAAVAQKGVEAIKTGVAVLDHYGDGSKYLDLTLPCGSAIYVLINPVLDWTWVDGLKAETESRRGACISFGTGGVEGPVLKHALDSASAARCFTGQAPPQAFEAGERFLKTYLPGHRVLIFGQGAIFALFGAVAPAFGFEIECQSPPYNGESLKTLTIDPFTSVVVLDHDHDHEQLVLEWCLRSRAAYIGCLGSKATHRQRVHNLLGAGFSDAEIGRLCAPAGVDTGGKSPYDIVLSIMAELNMYKNSVADAYGQQLIGTSTVGNASALGVPA